MTDTPPGIRGISAADALGEDGEPHTAPEGLPPFTFRHRLIPAVQAVVAARFDGCGAELAAFCAAVTARTANILLPGEPVPYDVLAGTVSVRLPGETRRPEGGSESVRTVTAWAGRIHPSGRMEVADLSSRHLGSWLSPARSPSEVRFPRAIWAFEDDVPRAFRFVFEREAVERVRATLRDGLEDTVEAAVCEALERFRRGRG